MTGAWRPIDILLAASSAGVVICAFLPWAKVSLGILSVTKDGIDGDGQITLLLGLLVVGIVLLTVYRRWPERWMLLAGLVGGALIIGVGVYDWIDLESKTTSNDQIKVNVSAGIGLVFTVIGGGVLAVASALRLWPKYVRRVRGNRQSGPDSAPPSPADEPPPVDEESWSL
jgi:hypothetical protein